MRILIATTQVPFVRGGAEVLAEGLRDALVRTGHEAEIVALPFKWYPPETIAAQVLAARLLDLSEFSGVRVDRVVGLKFPAYLVPHPSKVTWLVHQHRAAYDAWDLGHSDLAAAAQGRAARDLVRAADQRFLQESRAIFTISRNVSMRLARYNAIDSTPLYHPPAHAEAYRSEPAGDYFFFPSRIDPLKRQELVLDALAASPTPMKVVFAGRPDNAAVLESLRTRAAALGVDDRVSWLGGVDEAHKRELYARALAVVFPPVDEDYGYVTLEAMLAGRAVITCSDSGGVLEFVTHGTTGFIAAPSPPDLAAAMTRLWEDRALARAMGEAGRATYDVLDISWARVVKALCE